MAYRKWQLQIDNGEPRWGDPMSYYAARDAWNSVILDDVVLQVGEEVQRWQCGPCLVYPDDHKPATDLSHLQRVTDGVSALDVYRECFADVESCLDTEDCVRILVNLDTSAQGPAATEEFLLNHLGPALINALEDRDQVLVEFHDIWPLGPRDWPVRKRLEWVGDRQGFGSVFNDKTKVFCVALV